MLSFTAQSLARMALAAAMTLSLVTAFLVAAPTSAHAAPAQADTIVTLVNEARAQHGLRPMRVNASLTAIAQDWSQRQAQSNTMSHRPNFTSGYPSGWTRAAENVAWHSQNNPHAVFNGWMNSSGHRANILNPDLTDIGVGWVRASSGRYYATQNFATYTNVAPATVPAPRPAPSRPSSVGAHDYNGDGNTDVLGVNGAGQLLLYPGNGRSGWGRMSVVGAGWRGYTLVAPGDFNGDSRADLLGIAPDGNLYFYAGTGSGFASRVKIGHGWQGMTNVFSPGDFSGDGKADVIATTASGDMRIYYGTGSGRVSGSAKIGRGWQIYPDVFAGGDFNGDGKADILAKDGAGRLFAYYGQGNNAMRSRVQIGTGWASFRHVSSIGDFSGDGRTDVFGIDSRTGRAYLYPGTGRGTFYGRTQVGTGWHIFSTVL